MGVSGLREEQGGGQADASSRWLKGYWKTSAGGLGFCYASERSFCEGGTCDVQLESGRLGRGEEGQTADVDVWWQLEGMRGSIGREPGRTEARGFCPGGASI